MRYVILAILLSLAWPAHAQEPEPYKIFLPMVHGMAKCKETWRIVKPDGTINKVLNPSAETTGNFSAIAGTTVTRVTTDSFVGLQSYRVQSNNNNEGMTLTLEALANATHFVTLRVAGSLPPAWDWSLDNVNYRAPVLIESIDGDWDLYGLSFPAAQANGSTTLYIRQNGAGVGDFFIDGVQVEAKTYWTTYCDGTQEGCSWAGTAHASVSERSSQSRAGGRVLNLQSGFGFFVEEVVGVGAAPETINTRSYAILPGGELSGSKTESRNFTLIGRFIADSEEDLHAKRQELIEELGINTYPESQAIRIRFSGARVQKQISVHYTGGLEAQLKVSYGPWQVESDDAWRKLTHWTERLTIQFLSPDPMWYEIGESSAVLNTGTSATFRYTAGRVWSLGRWDDLGLTANPTTFGTIFALAWGPDNRLYVGGTFTGMNGVAGRDYIAVYDPSTDTWANVGGASDLNAQVLTLTFDAAGNLLVGGAFTNVDGIGDADYIALWDGAAWNAIGQPDQVPAFITRVDTIHVDVDTGDYYIGGVFDDWAGIANADNIVRWDISATTYVAISTGADDEVTVITQRNNGGDIYVGGGYNNIGGVAADGLAIWDGSNFTKLGDLAGGNAIAFDMLFTVDGTLFMTGDFTSIDGTSINFVGRWNGTEWFPLGTGLNNIGRSLAFGPDNILWLGGIHSEAGGVTLVDRISQWDGSVWSQVDVNLPGTATVYAVQIGSRNPVSPRSYDLFVGFDTTGGASYADVTTVTNGGSQPAFPKIVISRSGGTSAQLSFIRNERTAKRLLSEYLFQDGETLTINLEPKNKSVIYSASGSRLDAIKKQSDVGTWSLLPNDNVVSFFAITDGAVDSFMLWKDTYRSLD